MAEKEVLEQQGGGPKPDPPKPEEGIPPWMATFADMVTLLLCFFVLLLSFTNQDVTNFRKMMGSIQEALGVQHEDAGAYSVPYADTSFNERKSVRENREIVELGARIKKAIRAKDLNHMAKVSSDKSGVMLRLGNQIVFKKGSAELAEDAQKGMQVVIDAMENTDFNLVIRGNTDGDQVESKLYHSNWDLSAARAARCLRYILEHSDISANRMKAVGYASAKPILPSTSEENRMANRRVEFYYIPTGRSKW
ncbi:MULTISPECIES: flagellar motor protein MotB [unclassified Pseudodesulfovibrio]|uniref:flagellar motor protein MotB n=1 Tax=unclassified Pseudodesulfovibrio TaxID=2661612 RepID=UPI000FEBD2F7|nr:MULTISPECIES: flagellar motor protein MotB [unclassified Pseudodesulfovibrio]MCJ2163815.1 OmpA family protein [Pseudodesulfovibrio sp. S3-i]RWU05937.1 flagellar motor protein MotB [Pseudodesulfovibrio sp. S3]